MRTTKRLLALLGLAATLFALAVTPALMAQEGEDRTAEDGIAQDGTAQDGIAENSHAFRVSRGRTSYRLFCRNCHGKEGKGDGPIGEMLKVQPADLTALTENAGGEFPAESVYQTIDGRNDVRGHGSREMPIWGFSFQDPSRLEDQEVEVRERILDLVEFLETLQESPPSPQGTLEPEG